MPHHPQPISFSTASRSLTPDDIAEEETLLELYKAALGMA
nr:DUF2312 domain-containing protein [Cereibacter johrii]